MVSEQTRKNAEKSKDKAAVIDCTKAVNYIIYLIGVGLLQSPWKGFSPQDPRDCEGKNVLKVG
jgi:hypothetical protein